jgi:RimJ/RimL family protein N-acetyltransferase
MSVIPERLVGSNIVLRRWASSDAPLLLAAITDSIPALERWTPWVIPQPLEAVVLEQRLQKFHTQFDTGETYIYGIFDSAEKEVLGQAGLYARVGPGALEVGYFLRSSATGKGIATEATRLLVRLAFKELGVECVEARCEPGNVASSAVPRRLGFTLRETIVEPARTGEGNTDLQIWEIRAPYAT